MRHRFNTVLLVALIVCALGVITSQHLARKLYSDLEKEQKFTHQLEVEFGKLQLEQSPWAAHAQVERAAKERLAMHTPDPREIQVIQARPALSGKGTPP